ncbi:uncharacterized protein [Ptychodera flava]|uniref:uncharacterized protein n=1 Tax=Ptychodera flava TaxID=63121 RepID=UPI00396A19D0
MEKRLLLPSSLKIPRCYKPNNFGKLKKAELHHFSDASHYGYGQCSYLRLIDDEDRVSSSLVMGKSRVVPTKPMTVPRLELTAAVISARVGAFVRDNLQYEDVSHTYYTDSNAVLGFINNEAKRFHIFVANRVQLIRKHSSPDQWRHVDTKRNPADLASRGMTADELLTSTLWWKGPAFLTDIDLQQTSQEIPELDTNGPEVKKEATVLASQTNEDYADVLTRLEYFSSWHRAKRAIAACMQFREKLQKRSVKKPKKCEDKETLKKMIESDYIPVDVEAMRKAEQFIIKLVQKKTLAQEILTLPPKRKEEDEAKNPRSPVKKTSPLYRLDPYLDKDGIVRVGGRIRRANLPREITHPVLLPKQEHITKLVISHYHEKIGIQDAV